VTPARGVTLKAPGRLPGNRPQVEAQQCVQPSGTNQPCGLRFPSASSPFYILESDIPGGDSGGATPLPIPNRVVKPSRADGTVLATAWESRSLPGFIFGPPPRADRPCSCDRARSLFFVDMNTEGGIISASMALAMRYRSIWIHSGVSVCASRVPLIPNPKKRGGETQ
jgi:hypothetical protein